MRKILTTTFALALVIGMFSTMTFASSTFNFGILAYNEREPGWGTFNITNLTGPNSVDPTFPILTPEDITSLLLNVGLVGGGALNFTLTDFALNADLLSLDGNMSVNESDVLTAFLSLSYGPGGPTVAQMTDLSFWTLSGDSYLAELFHSDGSTLDADVDSTVIQTSGDRVAQTPEPSSILLMGLGLLGVVVIGKKQVLSAARG